MAETVDLMVVGLSGDISRDELTKKLMEEFGQKASAFQALLDAAYGDSDAYSAQSSVNFSVAEEGKAQLESLGISCKIVSSSTDDATSAIAPSNNTNSTDSEPQAEVAATEESLMDKSAPSANEGEFEEVDFSEELGDIGGNLDETSQAAEISSAEDKSSEEEIEDPSGSFDDLLSSDDSLIADSASDALAMSDESPAADSKKTAGSKSAVPEALASASFEELNVELIDPAPKEKEAKAPVELDDGGLSLSDDDSQPLTASKPKSDPGKADDGGLSLDGLADSDSQAAEKPAGEAPAEVSVSVEDTPSQAESDLAFDELAEVEQPSVAEEQSVTESSADELPVENTSVEVAPPEELPAQDSDSDAVPITNTLVSDSVSNLKPEVKPAEKEAEGADLASASVAAEEVEEVEEAEVPRSGGLVLPGQANRSSLVPEITAEADLEDYADEEVTDELASAVAESAVVSAPANEEASILDVVDLNVGADPRAEIVPEPVAKSSGKTKKIVAALAGVAVLAGGATFALMNAGSSSPSQSDTMVADTIVPVQDARVLVKQAQVVTGDMSGTKNLEQLSTEQLLINLSVTSNANTIVGLEPYFLESVNRNRSGPRFGAAVPAESDSMIGVKNRVPHPADKYFDEWSNRESDLLLFLALLDNLIEKGEFDVAQQLSDRAKDKLFSVMSTQRLARAYSEAGKNDKVTDLMALAARDIYSIKGPEERVLAISDFGLTEQALGLNEDAMDTFLKASILARNLGKPELKTVGLSSAARYFQRSGREREAQELLQESISAGRELPKNSAAHDLAARYVALTEARMGLFNQALENVRTIEDPYAQVSAYHGIALAIESTGDDTSARRVLNMAYRAGSGIQDQEERSELLSKVVLASESE